MILRSLGKPTFSFTPGDRSTSFSLFIIFFLGGEITFRFRADFAKQKNQNTLSNKRHRMAGTGGRGNGA